MRYDFSVKADDILILEKLQEHGVAIVEDYVKKDMLEKLNHEFNKLLDGHIPNSGAKVNPYSNGRCIILSPHQMPVDSYPAIKETFEADFMLRVKNAYLGPQAGLNTEIFVVNDVVGTKHHANDLHFDVRPTFKFFLYLTDTTEENGAFSCVPGSHQRTKKIRERLGSKISYKNRELSRDLPYTEDEIIPLEGSAGTLIIFTTETFHRAGRVHSGERRVMRGHCRLPKDQPRSDKSLRFRFQRVLQRFGL